jgi:hypothetical protein
MMRRNFIGNKPFRRITKNLMEIGKNGTWNHINLSSLVSITGLAAHWTTKPEPNAVALSLVFGSGAAGSD